MHTWAVLAAKEAAIASGLGAGIVPAVGAGSLDGFALGALMSGTCILMLTSPRRGRRRGLAASGGRALAAARGPAPAGQRRKETAAAKTAVPEAAAREAAVPEAGGRKAVAPEAAGDQAPMMVPPQQPDAGGSETGEGQDVAGGGAYRSRHRLADQGVSSRQPGTRRSSPRHAAPPASFSSRMTGRIAVRALVGGVRS